MNSAPQSSDRLPRHYFDHAATGWPKSPAVTQAMIEYIDRHGAASGRGVYQSAQFAAGIIQRLRQRLASAINASAPDCISLHANGTAALNAAILGLCRDGDHVVTTAAEHNSVLRPLEHLRQTRNVRVDVVGTDNRGRMDADAILAAISPGRTRMVVMSGASNVTGAVLPVAEVGRQLTDTPTLLVCDAAQNFGWCPVDVRRDGIDVLATPGHKGGGGPLGTAMMYVDPRWHSEIQPTVFGGTGSQSEQSTMPQAMPDKLEAGNLNVPAMAGWLAAIETWPTGSEAGPAPAAAQPTRAETQPAPQTAVIDQDRRRLCDQLVGAVTGHTGLHVVNPNPEVPIVSVHHDEIDATEMAMILDSEFGVEARAGWHCAAEIHRHLGTPPGGLLRFSAGPETTSNDFEALRSALDQICDQSSPA